MFILQYLNYTEPYPWSMKRVTLSQGHGKVWSLFGSPIPRVGRVESSRKEDVNKRVRGLSR